MTREERKKGLMHVAGQWRIFCAKDLYDMEDKLEEFILHFEDLIDQCNDKPENALLDKHREYYDYDSIKETLEELLTYVRACIVIYETSEELKACIKSSNY